MAHTEAARKGSTSLAAGSKQIAGLLEPGPSVIPMGPPATPMGPTMYVPPAGEGLPFTHAGPIPSTRPTVIPMGAPKAATRAAAETARAADETASAFEKTGDAWVSIGKGLEAPARVAAVMKASLESGAKRKDLIAMGPHMIREAEGATLGAPSGRTPLAREAIRFGYVSEKARRIREGEPTEMQERLAQLRIRTAGAAAYETARTPRGVAAVLGQLGLGGGQQYKVNQALLQNARIAANVTGAQVLGLEKEVGARKQSLAFLKDAGATEEDTAPIVQELAQQESSLADARKHHKVNLGELDKAEKAVLPTASNVIKSFGAIILSTSLYGAAFSAASMLIDKAAIPAMGRWVDQMTGWQATSTKVTSALGEQVYASHGNIAAVMAQTAANAGLSKSMMDYVGNAVEASAFAKAGAKAQGEASDLFRTAIRGGPPEGLYSGYGGILGTPLLGTEMGGGRGLTETISQDLKMLAGGRGKASADFPFIGNPANAQQNLGGGIDLLLDRDYRDYITGKGKQQGGFQGAVSTAIEIPGGVGDVLGGLGDAISSLNPFGQNFGATFLGGMKNAQGVPYAGSAPSGGTYGGRGGAFGGARGAAGRGVAAGLGSTRDMAAAETAATAYHPLAMLGTPDEQKGVTNYLEDLNKAIDRGATAAAHGTTGHYRLAKSQEEATKAEYAAIQAHDKNGIELAKQGVVLEDNAHTVVDNGKAYQAINEDLARGKVTVDEAVRAGLVTRQLQATQQANAIQTQRAINVELPFETTKQLLTQPIIKPGAGFFPGAGRGQPSAAAAGLSGGAARAAQSALSQTADANQQLQDIAKQGLAAARADITQFTPENLPDFNAAVKQAQGLSNSIASLTTHMASLNRAASQASWANQIRIATRALGDAIAMEGKAGGTRLGMLERESHFIERAQQALSLALEQRQITTKVALAGFQAPGETGEERYMRQKEQLAEAAIQQKQLNLSKQDFAVAGQSWVENVKRSAVDAAKAIEVMQKARDAEGYTIAAQEAVAKKEQLLANVVGKMDSLIGQARGNFNAVLQSAAGGVAEFGGAVDVAVREIYKSLGYKQDSRGNYYKPATDTATGGGARRPSMGYMGRHAAGYAGAATGGGAMFTVGEAGPETVAILRNPRTHMIQGEGGGGGGGAPVTVNINGPVVREDKDIAELARCVAEEVERTLSRKGQLLGLRSPAY